MNNKYTKELALIYENILEEEFSINNIVDFIVDHIKNRTGTPQQQEAILNNVSIKLLKKPCYEYKNNQINKYPLDQSNINTYNIDHSSTKKRTSRMR